MITCTCLQCGETKKHASRGLCGRCYNGLRHTGHLDRYPVIGPLGRPRGRPIARAHDRPVRGIRARTAAKLIALRTENRKLKTAIRRVMAALEDV